MSTELRNDEGPSASSDGMAASARSRASGACASLFGCLRRREGEELHPVTLRFRTAGLEKGYERASRARLLRTAPRCFAIATVCALGVLCMRRPWQAGPGQEVDEIMQLANGMLMSFAVSHIALILALRVPAFQSGVGLLTPEVITILGVCVPMLLMPLAMPWYAGRVLGFDPTRHLAAEYLSDTGLLLVLDAYLTCVHVALGVRFRFMPIFQIIAFLAYSGPAMVLQSPEIDNTPKYIALLAALLALSGMGKYNFERQERTHFLMLIEEKTMRVTTEFQLSKMRSENRQMEPSDSQRFKEEQEQRDERRTRASSCSSVGSTLKSTTESDLAFALNGTNEEIVESITRVGVKEQWLVKDGELSPLEDSFVGKGAFGVVTRGLYHGAIVAIKSPGASGDDKVKKHKLPQLCGELQVMRRLRHPNIVFLYGATLSSSGSGLRIALVMEFVVGKPLGDFLTTGAPPTEQARLALLLHMASALRYLHSREPAVVHGDLKDSNIYVESLADGESRAKLLDFGLSRRLTRSSAPMGGSLRWVAPELLRGRNRPHRSADVYSFGRVVFFVATSQLPFAEVQKKQLVSLLKKGGPPPWPDHCAGSTSPSYRSLVAQCSEQLPGRRPDIADVFQSLVNMGLRLKLTPTTSHSRSGELLRHFGAPSAEASVESSLGVSGGSLATVPEGSARSDGSSSTPRCYTPPNAALVHESYGETSMDIMKRSLALTVMQWNFRKPPSSCCWLHAAFQLTSELQGELLSLPCDAERVPVHGQCSGCGLLRLDDEEGWCALCGTRFSPTGSTAN